VSLFPQVFLALKTFWLLLIYTDLKKEEEEEEEVAKEIESMALY